MTKQPIISLSVIVPAYNEATNITRCLNSLIQQNMHEYQYEIIVVDDGSTDNTAEIALKISQNFDNVQIISQTNKNLGGARNTGLKKATGKYILFVDADDYIVENTLQQMLKIAEDNTLDILMCDFIKQSVDGKKRLLNDSYTNNLKSVLDGPEFIKKNQIFWTSWLCLYSRNFLLDKNIYFRENVYFEDVDISLKSVFYSQRIKYEPLFFYVHTYNINSITNSKRTIKKLNDQLTAANVLIKFLSELKITHREVFIIFSAHTSLKYIEAIKTSTYFGYKQTLEACRFVQNDQICLFPIKSDRLVPNTIMLLTRLSPILASLFIYGASLLVRVFRTQ